MTLDPTRPPVRPFDRLAGLAIGAALTLATLAPAAARPLEETRQRGEISVCANPNALPYASEDPKTPGFQIEIARALAERLGMRLKIDWIVPRMRAGLVDCDFLMDTILGQGLLPGSIKATRPYHASGVALALAADAPPLTGYRSLREGMRIGTLMNSLASLVVSRTGATMVTFGFEDDLVQAVAGGKVTAAAVSAATVGYYNLTHPGQTLKLVHPDDEPELRWNVAVGLRRADEPMIAAMNDAVQALLADGTIARIYARYGIEHRRP